jgi:soluble lytic murein transglycosylase-like protein
MVTAFPFALTETIPTAIEQATTLAYSTEENFAYAMPSATETSTVASVPSVQKPLLASANFEAGIPVGYASPVKKAKKVKQTNGTRGFWSRLFHRKKVTVAIPSNTSTSYSLPSPWRIAEEPAPTAQEQLLMNFIRKTNPKWDEFNSHALAYWLITVGQQFEVDPRVLASLIAVESSFRYDAVSTSNAKGFGQLKDDTANWLGVTDAFDPLQNLQGTAKYLQYLGQKFPEDASKAIGSYYVGQGTVERQGMTDAAWYYVSKVQRYLDELLQQSASIQ